MKNIKDWQVALIIVLIVGFILPIIGNAFFNFLLLPFRITSEFVVMFLFFIVNALITWFGLKYTAMVVLKKFMIDRVETFKISLFMFTVITVVMIFLRLMANTDFVFGFHAPVFFTGLVSDILILVAFYLAGKKYLSPDNYQETQTPSA